MNPMSRSKLLAIALLVAFSVTVLGGRTASSEKPGPQNTPPTSLTITVSLVHTRTRT